MKAAAELHSNVRRRGVLLLHPRIAIFFGILLDMASEGLSAPLMIRSEGANREI